MRMLNAREAVKAIKLLVYGRTGVGKTTLAKTLPPPTVLLDFEGGVLALLDTDISIVPIESVTDLREAVNALRDHSCNSVMFDGLSLFVRRRLEEVKAGKPYATWQDWQAVVSDIRSAILPLLHIPKHLVLTCLPRYVTEVDQKSRQRVIVSVEPDLPPSLLKDITAAVDLVALLVHDDPLFPEIKQRSLLFASVNAIKIVAKSRIPNLTISPPDFHSILALLSQPSSQVSISQVTQIAEVTSPEQQTVQPVEQKQETAEQKVEPAAQAPAKSEDSLASRIFETAHKLGIDNKALGRIAKQYFGQPYVRNLTQEEQERLLRILNEQLQRKQTEAQSPTQPEAETDKDKEVEEFVSRWREYRAYDGELPLEREFATIATRLGWSPQELESMLFQSLLEHCDELPIEHDQHWLLSVDVEILRKVYEELLRDSTL